MRIHVLGAAGAGATTLGTALARELGCALLDTDDFRWVPSDPPYEILRDRPARMRMLRDELALYDDWVLAGAFVNWSDGFERLFTHIIFLSLDHDVRQQRLLEREIARFGDRVLPGGDMYEHSKEFLAYASLYESGRMDVRSRAQQEHWLQQFDCPILRLDSIEPIDALVQRTLRWLHEHSGDARRDDA